MLKIALQHGTSLAKNLDVHTSRGRAAGHNFSLNFETDAVR
jgi:hypothetical protein